MNVNLWFAKNSDMTNGTIWTDTMINEKVKLSRDKAFEILQDVIEHVNKNMYGFILNEYFTTDNYNRQQLWLIKDFCTAFEKSTGYKTINIK